MVLDPSGGRLSGMYRAGGLALGSGAHHLWECDADSLLESLELYPLAVLGRTDNRESIVEEIIRRARSRNDPTVAARIAKNTATLANVYLPRHTLEHLLRRTDMPIDLRELPMVREAMEEGREEGRELGLEEGRQEGRDEGLHEALVAVAREKFGELPAETIDRLLDPSREFAAATRHVVRSISIDELNRALA